jgi:hypothetical protein
MMIARKEGAMRDKSYWETVSKYGVPVEDRDRITCEGDTGHGPCGTYRDWGLGMCAKGHTIEFEEDGQQ